MKPRKINKIKIKKAIESTEKFITEAEAKGVKEIFKMGNDVGFTILWCEKRNLSSYKEIINLTYLYELKNYGLYELYQAI